MTKGTSRQYFMARPHSDQRGITGLETAIVLIAFVVVASVFAFAVLSTGLLSAEKSKETVLGGLADTSATMHLRGNVIADANAAKTSVDTIKFTVTPASTSSGAVDLSTTGTVVTYLDEDQGINCNTTGIFDGDPDTAECSWSPDWLIGSPDLLGTGEQVEIKVTLTNLSPLLAKGTEFTIQIKPNIGAVVIVNRTLPKDLKGIMDLN